MHVKRLWADGKQQYWRGKGRYPRLAKLKNSPSLRTRDGYVLKSIRIRLECGQFERRMDENSFFGITVL